MTAAVTLLLQLAGPLQSWGSRSRFGERDTERAPTRSGVTGLVCAALGRDRSAPLNDLDALRFGVRVDAEGTLMRDFHTAQGVLKADKSPPRSLLDATHLEARALLDERRETTISNRYYLCDAVFLAGFEGDRELLSSVQEALRRPHWPLYLGRKSCVPSRPVWLRRGLVDGPLEEALASFPWLGRSRSKSGSPPAGGLPLLIESPEVAEGQVSPDRPRSFEERRFELRSVRRVLTPAPGAASPEDGACS